MNTGQSVWIILEPSEGAYGRLKEAIEWRGISAGGIGSASMDFHVAILIASGQEWGKYLEDLRGQIQRLVRATPHFFCHWWTNE